jgi:hypothetical protein
MAVDAANLLRYLSAGKRVRISKQMELKPIAEWFNAYHPTDSQLHVLCLLLKE